MDILVCFKVVPDLDMLVENDWVIDNRFRLDTSFVKPIINLYDEGALELALKLRDAALKDSLDLKLTALTIGTNHSNHLLKNLYSVKYDHVVTVECALDIRFNAPMVSLIIHQYIKKIKDHQVIILGQQGSEGNNGKTPLLVAERQGIPCITGVTNIKLSVQKYCLDITSQIDDLIVEQTVKPPVVLVIGNVPNSYIRVPTLKDKIHYGKREIEVYSLADLDLKESAIEDANDCELVELFYEKHERSCVFIQGEQSSQKASVLYEDYLRENIKL